MTIEETFFNSVAAGDEQEIEAIKAKAASNANIETTVPDGGAVEVAKSEEELNERVAEAAP